MDFHHSKLVAAVAVSGTLLYYGSKTFYRLLLDKTTCMLDLPDLGKPTLSKYRGRAVICGGSLAGLLTARMLVEHFDEVVVIEPEKTDEDGSRRGNNVVQWNHIHGFGSMNVLVWEKLFPDIANEIKKVDGRLITTDLKIHYDRPLQPVGKDFPYLSAYISRPAIESVIRRLSHRTERVRFVQGLVTGLAEAGPGTDALKGVRYTETARPDHHIELEAALVIDATGQYHRGVKWLKDLGYEAPEKESYNPRTSYSSTYIKMTPEIIKRVPWPQPYDKIAWIQLAPCAPGYSAKGTYVVRYDGDRICILALAFGDEEMPKTPKDVYNWARSCNMEAWVHELIDILEEHARDVETSLTRLGPFTHFRYDKLVRKPRNFIPIGDSVLKLNPAYGQGAAKAASEVATLDAVLRRARSQKAPYADLPMDLPEQYFKKQTPRALGLVDANKAFDYGFDTTERALGDSPNHGWFLRYWFGQVNLAAMFSSRASEALELGINGLAPPTVFFGPAVLWPLLLHKVGLLSHRT